MKLRPKSKQNFYCFSPPVMLATLALELIFLVYVIAKYKMTTLSRLVGSILFFLAVFQLAEYFVCGGLWGNALTWSRIGFVAITILPALGIHLLYTIAGKGWNNLIGTVYGMTIAWIVVFAVSEKVFSGNICAGNYVIFQVKPAVSYLYTAHYFFWLFVGTYLCIKFSKSLKDANSKKALLLFGLGYATLLVPTTTVNLLKPETLSGVPSIMCGLAIVLAGILTFGIMPLVAKPRTARK